jgi:hypothetical protein
MGHAAGVTKHAHGHVKPNKEDEKRIFSHDTCLSTQQA